MSKGDEYTRLAAQCLELARELPAESRPKLLEMAATWTRLASEVAERPLDSIKERYDPDLSE